MRFEYLNELADIVVHVDEYKNITNGNNVVSMTDRGIRLIAQMKLEGMDVGELQEIFSGMQIMCDNPVVLTELIDMAHEAIVQLLGKDAWRVYGCDEGGWFFQIGDVCVKVAA